MLGPDFGPALAPIQFNLFGQPQPARPKKAAKPTVVDPIPIASKPKRRHVVGLRRAVEVLRVLPAEGESLHCILYGFFDLCALLVALLQRAQSPATQVRIGTLSFSKRNVVTLAALMESRQIQALDLLTSDFQAKYDAGFIVDAVEKLNPLGGRVATARSHCKLITVALEDGRRYVFEGSANLRTSRNAENVCLSRDAKVHDFYADFLDKLVTKHEIGAGGVTAADRTGDAIAPDGGDVP